MNQTNADRAGTPRVAVAVLAAGGGTRMQSSQPKHVHLIAGVPMVARIMQAAQSIQPYRLMAIVSPETTDLAERVGMPGAFEAVVQDVPRGTADAVRTALEAAPDADYLVSLLGDNPLLTGEIVQSLMNAACETGALLTLLACHVPDAASYGRIERDPHGQPVAIIEAKNDDPAQRIGTTEINSGILVVNAAWGRGALARLPLDPRTGEYLLTDLVAMAATEHTAGQPWPITTVEGPIEVSLGVNNRIQQADAEEIIRERICNTHMLNGVTMIGRDSIIIDETVTIGRDTILLPGTMLLGETTIGEGCRIGPNAILDHATIGDRVVIQSSTIEHSTMEDDTDAGPYAHLRGKVTIRRGAHVGNYAEMKNVDFGEDSKCGHMSYLGDAVVGKNVNIGAGTITANYDGIRKNATNLHDDVFVGSGSVLVAPVTMETGAKSGANAVVRKDVAAGETVVGVPAKPIRRPDSEDGRGA